MPDASDLNDLLLRISRGDEIAFRRMFHSFSGLVYSFSLRLTRSRHTAEEIVQEAFLKLWVNRESLSRIENFNAYLFTVTRNLTFNVIKHKRIEDKAKQAFRYSAFAHEDTEGAVVYSDYQQFLNNVINHLPPQQRLVYSMSQQEGLRYEEIASKLKISRLTVKSHLQQARRTIKMQFSGILNVLVLALLIVV